MPVRRVIAGGQTGADRGALDAAIELSIEHGGFCPLGRRAEDGAVPAQYKLTETRSASYKVRTEENVLAADATLVFSRGAPSGGTALTLALARRHRRPWHHVDLGRGLPYPHVADAIRAWLREHRIEVLNVAGPRESSCPGIGANVRTVLALALAPDSSDR